MPNLPEVTKVDCNNKRAIISWKKPDAHGSEIVKFTVEMKTDFKPDRWQVVVEETEVTPAFYQSTITLSPWVNYTFRVFAFNSYGPSEPGYPQNVLPGWPHCSTDKSVPYSNPSNVVAAGDEPDNLVIQWAPMEKYDWNAPELMYLIRYKLNTPETQWKEFLIEDPLEASFVFFHLQPLVFRTIQLFENNRLLENIWFKCAPSTLKEKVPLNLRS